jgi:hypothetical protein
MREWVKIDGKNLDLSWPGVLGRLLMVLGAGQRRAAAAGPGYLARALAAQRVTPRPGHRLAPDAFSGVASDGRQLASLLYTPVAESKHLMSQGARLGDAVTQAGTHLAVIARTQVQDAGRMAVQTAMADDEAVRGYVRHVNLPSCARCIILAGRFYRYSSGFLRHPNCDCQMIPAAGEEFVEGQDPEELIAQMREQHPERLRRSLTEGDLKALDHGADLNQVVNAHRGMATAAGPGRKLSVTLEGTTRRGLAGSRLIREHGARQGHAFQRVTAHGVTTARYSRARAPRLTPAQIFDEAGRYGWDRAEIVRQLTRFGYLI